MLALAGARGTFCVQLGAPGKNALTALGLNRWDSVMLGSSQAIGVTDGVLQMLSVWHALQDLTNPTGISNGVISAPLVSTSQLQRQLTTVRRVRTEIRRIRTWLSTQPGLPRLQPTPVHGMSGLVLRVMARVETDQVCYPGPVSLDITRILLLDDASHALCRLGSGRPLEPQVMCVELVLLVCMCVMTGILEFWQAAHHAQRNHSITQHTSSLTQAEDSMAQLTTVLGKPDF